MWGFTKIQSGKCEFRGKIVNAAYNKKGNLHQMNNEWFNVLQVALKKGIVILVNELKLPTKKINLINTSQAIIFWKIGPQGAMKDLSDTLLKQ